MQPPRSQITIRDIAEQLGISHSTVSRALRNSPLIGQIMKDRVNRAAQELGYVADSAARTMRGEPSSLIGFVLPDVRPDFFSALTTEFGRACAERGFNLILSISQHDPVIEEAQIRALRGARVAGVLIYPTADFSKGSARLLKGVPTVQVARRHPAIETSFVGTDDAASMATLVGHLADLGHQHIGFIGSDPRFSPGSDRLGAFREALRRLDRAVDESLIRSGMASAQAGGEATKALLDASPRPTAIMIASAPMAEGALDVLQRRGLRVPEDISFTSFGDPFWYRAWGPGITTVAMPVKEVVEASLDLLLAEAQGPDGTVNSGTIVRIPTHVVLRRTTARPA